MLNMTPIRDAGRAADYFAKGDGGYYLDGSGLRRQWGGRAAERLELTGPPEFEQFHRLLHGLHPRTGEQLTALLTEDRLAGWDFTASLPKGITMAMERGDRRIQQIVYDAGDEAMADIERHAMTRVRKGGRDADRVTGNMAWLVVEHPETRPAQDDGKPDWDRHLHYVCVNATWDADEGQWKAMKVNEIFTLRKYFSHQFDLRLAAKLADAGYSIATEYAPDAKGGMKYKTWDIKPAPGHEAAWDSARKKTSRRTRDIEAKATEIVTGIRNRDPDNAPEALGAVARNKLSLTTRAGKLKDMTLDALRAYWDSRLASDEKAAVSATIDQAERGLNPAPESRAAEARAYAMAHHFYRSSVVDFHDLATTAMERCMGAARPGDFARDAWREDGLLFSGDECSTQAVLDQEQRIIGFARQGKGAFRPLAPGRAEGLEGLSDEQAAAVRHVWNSRDRVMLIRGAPGAGKTTLMRPALDRIGSPVVLLAPSSDASRGKLRADGFEDADTVAAFLGSGAMQARARNGIIWIDEASLLGIDDLERICGLAGELEARIVLQGDPRQHKAVQRNGNLLEVLADYAGLPVAEIRKIQRQKGEYAQAVEDIRAGRYEEGIDRLYKMSAIIEGEGHDKLVERYAQAVGDGKGEPRGIIIVDPTHRDGAALTEKLRGARKAAGLIRGEERAFTQWTALNWTPAQQADAARYAGDEVIQFFRNSGRFKAGQRVAAAELLPHLAEVKPEHFGVFKTSEDTLKLAAGDIIRVTNNGRDVTGKHRLDNGRIDTIRRFTRSGDIELSNGWVISKDFAHLKHGLVSTSPAAQSKDDQHAWQQLNRASLGAAGAEQFLVSLSRGKQTGLVFTDLSRDELVAAVRRADNRRSATEVFLPRPQPKPPAAPAARAAERAWEFMQKVRDTYRQWRDGAARRAGADQEPQTPSLGAYAARVLESLKQQELEYER